MSKVKCYRVTAIQPVHHVTYVNATSLKDAKQMCKIDMDSDGNDIIWKNYDIGSWYGYQAEEID